jgi:uncharacterized protein YbjT (DUF2867 family)
MKAIIIGATGLIGQNFLSLLEIDEYFTEIDIWLRKPIKIDSSKVKIKHVDFERITENEFIHADVVFCCVGTTIKKAKTRDAFLKVDFDIPVNLAKLCANSNIQKLIIISSLGADRESKNNYLKTKGEMEYAVSQYNIPSIVFLRPSILLGNRNEFRLGEIIGKIIIQLLGFLLLGKNRKYRGIRAMKVAKAMLNIAKNNTKGIRILESNEIEKLN